MTTGLNSAGRKKSKRPGTPTPVAVVLVLGLATAVAMGLVFALYPRAPTPDVVTGSINQCSARTGNYSPRMLDQCVNACISCDRGTITTCTTACRLKGAL